MQTDAKPRLEPVSDAWVEHVDTVAKRVFGAADLQAGALAAAVDQVSRGYTVDRDQLGAPRTRTSDLVARLKLFSIRDLPKIEAPLIELGLRGALPAGPTWRVLDVGAGVGTCSLGVARMAARCGVERVHVRALDRDGEALRVFRELAVDVSGLSASPIELDTLTTDLSEVPKQLGDARFDLIVIGFVANELWSSCSAEQRTERASAWLIGLSRMLTDNGALIVLEPALREQTRELQRVRDMIVARGQAPHVYAPCVHSSPCPMLQSERDWCHVQLPWPMPRRVGEIARAAGLRDHDLTFSYLTLRNRRGDVGGDGDTASVPGTEGRAAQRVVSALLPSKGKVELLVCGAQGLSRLMRLDRHRSVHNAGLDRLGRGATIHLPVLPAAGARVRVGPDDAVHVDWHW